MTDGAQQRLVFGRDRDVTTVEEAMERTRSRALRTNPCVLAFGPDPQRRTCGDCSHLFARGDTAGTYYKCDLRRVTGGAATDHRVGWHACTRFEERT